MVFTVYTLSRTFVSYLVFDTFQARLEGYQTYRYPEFESLAAMKIRQCAPIWSQLSHCRTKCCVETSKTMVRYEMIHREQ